MPLSPKGALIARVKDLLKNRIRFSAFDLSREAKQDFYRWLKNFRPRYFYGYPSLIVEFCRFAAEEGMDLSQLPLKAVIGTGEFVYPKEREAITAATGVPFVSEYGCTEIGVVGFECEHGSLHLMPANVYLEVIKDGKSVVDEEGDVYVTELHATHFPFLRYGLGDRGVLSSTSCPCGRHLPVLQIVSSRKDDYVITPEGGKVYDAIFAYILKRGIDQFKAVQLDPKRIEIFATVNGDFSSELEHEYKEGIRKHLSPSMEIVFTVVDVIERQKSGKLRYFERRF
jgi:phenylacetate-CoA ligase